MNTSKSLLIAAGGMLLVGAVALGSGAWAPRASASAQPAAAVRPTIGPVRDVIIAKGTVAYAHQVSVRAPVSGRVGALAVNEGSDVRRGQPLLAIEDAMQGTDGALRALERRASEDSLAALRKDVEVARRLVEIGSAPRFEFEQKSRELAAAERELDRTALELQRHATRTGLSRVTSPLNGLVLAVPVVAGQSVSAGEELMTLAGGDAMSIVAYVDAMEIERLRVGQPVEFSDQEDGGVRRRGSIREIGRAVAGAQRQNAVKVVIAAPSALAGLRMAQQLYIEFIVLDEPAVLRVPREFVRRDGERKFVHVQTAKGVEARPVRTLPGDASFERVVSGLSVSDSLTKRPVTVASR